MKVLFSSNKSVEPLRKRILRNFNKQYPKKYDDPEHPNIFRGYLENTIREGYELSTLSNRDSDELTRAFEPFYLKPCIETAKVFFKSIIMYLYFLPSLNTGCYDCFYEFF